MHRLSEKCLKNDVVVFKIPHWLCTLYLAGIPMMMLAVLVDKFFYSL